MKNLTDITKFDVIYDNIIIEPIKETEAVGDLVLPQGYEDKPQLGTVIKVGEGRLMENGIIVPFNVKIGDVILFNKYSTTQFLLKGKEYLVLRSEDIIAIYRND